MIDLFVSGTVTETSPLTLVGVDRIVFDPAKTSTLVVPNLILHENSTLTMQPANGRVKHTITIDYPVAMEAGFVGGSYVSDATALTDPGIWVRDNASAHLAGRRPHPVKHLQAATGNTLVVDTVPSGWYPGDLIVVCPSAQGDFTSFEERTIVKVVGRTVTVDTPLAVQHPSLKVNGLYVFPEVLHLERNVELNGNGKGGGHPHMHIQSTAKQEMVGVCWENFGVPQDDLLGRYPVHIHHCFDANRGQIWSHNLVQRSGQRAFVPHESHGITWLYCIAYDVNREAFWWDPKSADETTETNDNHWQGCVGAKVSGKHDNMATFELRNGTGNAATSCVAVGNTGQTESAGFSWPTNANGTWGFTNNVAHNNKGHGAWVWQNTRTDHLLSNFVAYRNGKAGIHEGSYLNHYDIEGGAFVANQAAGVVQTAVSDNRGAQKLTYHGVLIDCQGQSDNAIQFSPPEIPTSKPGLDTSPRFVGCTLTGYRKYAIGFVPGAKTPNGPQEVFSGCTVDDMKTLCWFEDWLDPETFIQFDAMKIVPLNDPRPGTLHPEWNAKVLT